jgi:hypothetical protein
MILKNDLLTVLQRSMVRSAADSNHRNKRVSFKLDVQESLSFVCKDSHHKHKSRNTNNDVSNRITCKADDIEQHIGIRTRYKLHIVNNVSVPNLFFPLNDAI